MSECDGKMVAGACPRCSAQIPVPEFLAGMWSGCKPNGTPAGGAFYEVECGGCGAALEAYDDVYDDLGEVPVPDKFVPPELYWSEREKTPGLAAGAI
jgi:hypothetical protein